ncbi:hypothetical protein [Brucella intermedia]|uniref:hypothetical protein n=1 Tax=Brucella intermedia TaxID=94625 RepID=UPI00124E47F0|nr:hypothetical protein [Brucella intermedia]KAB2715326.1 hypothetical protein F9K75_18690 [Brucella intermedia]
MSNRFLALAAAVTLSLPASAAGAANDPYVGEYVGTCPHAQCFVKITKKKGRNYHLRFTAADPMDARKILCRAEIPMQRGRLEFTINENYHDALSGEYKSDPLVWLLAFDDGSIHFYVENAPCGRFDMSGEYGAFGDE